MAFIGVLFFVYLHRDGCKHERYLSSTIKVKKEVSLLGSLSSWSMNSKFLAKKLRLD